jgi:exodeoxyribonuclease VII small subunit
VDRPHKADDVRDFTLGRSVELAVMAKAATPTEQTRSPADPPNYEQALAELESLVSAMENAQLPLDDLLQSYRRGAFLLQFCRARLQAVEQQVKVLERGELEPWSGK